jgi:aspartate carbamoyltransferase catalytic subunit
MTSLNTAPILKSKHLLGIEGLSPFDITALLDLAETYVTQGRASDKKTALLKGRTLINLFFAPAPSRRSSWPASGWAPT